MAERSKFFKLPEELRAYIEKRWAEGDTTLDDLLAVVREKAPDAEISRTGLGRHLAKYTETSKRLREAREVAAGIMKEIGATDDSQTGRLLAEMLSSLAFNTLEPMVAKGQGDTKELFFLSMALKNLASAKKTEIDRELKIRKEMLAAAEKKLDEKASEAKASGTLDAAAIEKAKELVRGVLSV